MRRINIATIEGKPAVSFDTGLDPRSFARTKMSQSLIETGIIISPNGQSETWKPAGVHETKGLMSVWGPLFDAERLDLLLEKIYPAAPDNVLQASQQAALQAVACWIRAKMLLGEKHSTLNPGAAFVRCKDETDSEYKKGSVFFAPEHLSNRCLFIEGSEIDRYNCPDLAGMEAIAFCAGLMLYRILAGVHPYPAETIYQDMREGIYLPPHLAVAGLNEKLSYLINCALLLSVEKKQTSKNGADILVEILEIIADRENRAVDVSSLFNKLSTEKNAQIEKERKQYLFRQNNVVKIRRFAIHNKYPLIGITAGLLFIFFVVFNMTKSDSRRPTTASMDSKTVIIAYYDAFSALDHVFMEACIMGADRTDINAAASLFAVEAVRRTYEFTANSAIIPARVWKEMGGELPAPNVFGVTDMEIEYLAGDESDNMMIYRADYLLWSPDDDYAIKRSDVLTLRRDKRKNWRITEILRTEH